MDMEERKANGQIWTDTGEYMDEQTRAKTLMYEFNHSRPDEKERRGELIRAMFGSAEDVWIEPPITFARGKTVTIGEGTYINSNLTMVDDWTITIGSHVLFAPNVTISTTGHPVHPDMRPNGEMYSLPVVIEDWVWIGSNVVILPGVTIGRGSVIGAGSVVTRDIPPMVVAAGIPCKVVREITDRDREYYYQDRRFD